MYFDPSVHVVSYLVPTSNHNAEQGAEIYYTVVSYLVPTSNHNYSIANLQQIQLYLI